MDPLREIIWSGTVIIYAVQLKMCDEICDSADQINAILVSFTSFRLNRAHVDLN